MTFITTAVEEVFRFRLFVFKREGVIKLLREQVVWVDYERKLQVGSGEANLVESILSWLDELNFILRERTDLLTTMDNPESLSSTDIVISWFLQN